MAILLCVRILLIRHAILNYTIPKPYVSGMLKQSITGFFSNSFDQKAKIACQGGVGGLNH